MEIELIVFDLAGTTVADNKDVHRVLQSALNNFGISITIDEANTVMGIPKPVAIKQLLQLKNYQHYSPGLIEKVHDSFVNQMIDFYRKDPSVKEKKGVSETWRILKDNGIKVAVDTGFDRAITEPLLQRMGWKMNGLLNASVTSDEVPKGRPYPDLIFKAMMLTGVTEVKKVAKVGDTASDLQEGAAAGCGMVIGVTTGAFTRAELMKGPHTHLIEEIPEILSLLNIR